MIAGTGLDIVDTQQFSLQLQDEASSFVNQTFTLQEQTACQISHNRLLSLAARWAAKEAFVKAWSASRRGESPLQQAPNWQEIEVIVDPWHRPTLVLHGETARLVGPLRIHLSLSHDGPVAAAMVILEQTP